MIKIKFEYDQYTNTMDNSWYLELGIRAPENRPYICRISKISDTRYYHHLNVKMHEWLLENNIEYRLDMNDKINIDPDYYIVFDSKKDAILFKLTWC
jgi:hypothetical protein